MAILGTRGEIIFSLSFLSYRRDSLMTALLIFADFFLMSLYHVSFFIPHSNMQVLCLKPVLLICMGF